MGTEIVFGGTSYLFENRYVSRHGSNRCSPVKVSADIGWTSGELGGS